MTKPFSVPFNSAIAILFACSAIPAFAQHGGGWRRLSWRWRRRLPWWRGVPGGGGMRSSGGGGFRGGSSSPPAAGYRGPRAAAPSAPRSGGGFAARPATAILDPAVISRAGISDLEIPLRLPLRSPTAGGIPLAAQPEAVDLRALQSQAGPTSNAGGFHVFSGNRGTGRYWHSAQLFGPGWRSLGEFSRRAKCCSQVSIAFHSSQFVQRFSRRKFRVPVELNAFRIFPICRRTAIRGQSRIFGWHEFGELVPTIARL